MVKDRNRNPFTETEKPGVKGMHSPSPFILTDAVLRHGPNLLYCRYRYLRVHDMCTFINEKGLGRRDDEPPTSVEKLDSGQGSD